jgi:acyl-CoA reductase-like NAD-dependent aldehyde dehydrogenase
MNISTSAHQHTNTISSVNPATLARLGTIPCATPAEVTAAVARARAAQPAWAARPMHERAAVLRRARAYLLAHLDAFAQTITEENGKPRVEALTAELYPSAELLHYVAGNAGRLLRAHGLSTGLMRLLLRQSTLHYRAHGVVAIIAPWNYPFSIPVGAIAMALIAGNSVVLKPSEYTSRVAQCVEELFRAADLPQGLLQCLYGFGDVGAALVDNDVDKVMFTGSLATGKKIMAACASRPIPCTLELGGKDPMLVCADADLELASSAAVWGAFTNAGQCCASIERCYVDRSVAEPFIQAVVAKTNRLRMGDGSRDDVDIGPLTTKAQLATVERHIADAKARGATILTGGARPRTTDGLFYPPTVVTNVTHDFLLMHEETFGPTLPIMIVEDMAEAVRLANDSAFGLSASVWSRDLPRAREIAMQLSCGTVTINECLYTHAIAQTPWGGRKGSGFGRTHGKIGLLEMVEPFHIHTNHLRGIKDMWWYPYSRRLYDTFRWMTQSVTGGWPQRILAIPKLLAAALRRKL